MSKNTENKFIQLLHKNQATLFETATSDSRIHDAFVNILRMTPEEIKNKGELLTVNYSFSESQFGQVLIASTHKGLCYMGFSDDEELAFQDLQRRFPKARFIQQSNEFHRRALNFLSLDSREKSKIDLHLNGTDFQFMVWEELLKIPMGRLTSYGEMAISIHKPKAARAIGTAIGSNPIAFIIPCHRVIQATGGIGGYMWGAKRKVEIIEWEVGLG